MNKLYSYNKYLLSNDPVLTFEKILKINFMKKAILFVITGIFMIATGYSQISNQVGHKAIAGKYEQVSSGRAAANVLVFRDELAWGVNTLVPALVGTGATVTTATSAEMATIDLTPFCLVIFESNQSTDFYTTYIANLAKFSNWVMNGGTLEFHACVYSSTRDVLGATPLPGGASTFATSYLDITNYIADAGHPINAGLSDPLTGSYASHDAFTNLVAGTDIINTNTTGLPTTIEYMLGQGRVVATGQTWEIANELGWNVGTEMVNCVNYTTAVCSNQVVPLNTWAIFAGIFLILAFTVIRYRRA